MNLCDCGEEREHRHFGIVEVNERLMAQFCQPTPQETWVRIEEGLPPDATLCSADFELDCLTYRFLYESRQFPSCLPGAQVSHRVQVTMSQLFLPDGLKAGVMNG